MYKRITMINGKKYRVVTIKNAVIECFCYAMKYYTQTSIKVNKTTWTIKFNNGEYDYTFVLPKDFMRDFTMGKY